MDFKLDNFLTLEELAQQFGRSKKTIQNRFYELKNRNELRVNEHYRFDLVRGLVISLPYFATITDWKPVAQTFAQQASSGQGIGQNNERLIRLEIENEFLRRQVMSLENDRNDWKNMVSMLLPERTQSGQTGQSSRASIRQEVGQEVRQEPGNHEVIIEEKKPEAVAQDIALAGQTPGNSDNSSGNSNKNNLGKDD